MKSFVKEYFSEVFMKISAYAFSNSNHVAKGIVLWYVNISFRIMRKVEPE